MPHVTGVPVPPPAPARWTARRKAEVAGAVRDGRLAAAEACARHGLSPEELASWERALDRHGVRALGATRLQEFRRR